jgi:DNA adenine methylase
MAKSITLPQFRTPLRYPGGKGRLAQYVCDLMTMNDLVGGHYIEPYAGGAGIGVTLMFLEYASRIHLNDLNKSVFAFWKSVCDEPEALCRMVRDTRPTMTAWRKQRKIQAAENATTLELGFSTFFLNRTNRSGIISGGVIGGQKQTGKWKIDARYNSEQLARRIEKIASFAPRINLYNLDAAEFLTKHVAKLPKKSLIYLDPPYYMPIRGLYQDSYGWNDHKRLAGLMRTVKQKWIISYNNALAIKRLYSGYDREIFSLRYSAQDRYSGTEIMVFCPELKRPDEIEIFRGMAA